MTATSLLPPPPRLHAITDERVARRKDLDSIAKALALGAGTDLALHARGRGLTGLEHLDLADRLSACRPARLFVNDRLDVALAVPAAGVQLGAGSLTPADARCLKTGRGWCIGCSVHDLDEARAVLGTQDEAPDYLMVGPVYQTASHPGDTRPPLGLAALRSIVALGLPVIAIGGITLERVREVRNAGAYGVAAIRALWDAPDPAAAARAIAGACAR